MLDLLNEADSIDYRISNALVKTLFRGVLLAVHELETLSNLLHLDLKLENMILTKEGRIRLIDFG